MARAVAGRGRGRTGGTVAELEVFPGPGALARAAADRVVAAAGEAIRARGTFRFGVSGGRTPLGLYRRLAGLAGRIDWSRTEVLFADERGVAPTDPESNFRLVCETLAGPVAIPPAHLHRMRGEAPDLDAAAAEYEPLLVAPLDLLVLGVGEDGHVASLFPNAASLAERERRVVAVLDSPKPPSRRLTVTPRVLEESRQVVVLASGSAKARAVALALDGSPDVGALPARLLRGRTWLVDRAAAGAWTFRGR